LLNEFTLIEEFFTKKLPSPTDVLLGIGDDGAVLKVPADQALVIAVDTLVAGVHFPVDTAAADIGFKALAVNLSDLAAMGAYPRWITLALTLPAMDTAWLQAFAQGLFTLADQYQIQLVGGDTTRGPLTITIQAHGFVPAQQTLRRSGAKIGDKIYVSGTLGDAGLGLQIALHNINLPSTEEQFLLQRLNRPLPRVELGLLLRQFATSAIDISDGLLADLTHITEQSHVGATLTAEQLPLSSALSRSLSHHEALQLALTAGDDYELCFTIPAAREQEFLLASNQHPCTCIGFISEEPGITLVDFPHSLLATGYRHF
jgi:thiamine-monophosphate kinase